MRPGLQPLRILLVNDEIAFLRYLGVQLTSWGHMVDIFVGCSENTAKKIIEAARKVRFHAAIIDVIMPGMHGMQLIELIHRASPDTQFIVADCGACVTVAVELRKKGISARPLLCPFESAELQELLARIASSRRRRTRVRKDRLADGESGLKGQLFSTIKTVVSTFDPEKLGLNGLECNNYDADCWSIADFVWAHFPYPSPKTGVGILRELILAVFPECRAPTIDTRMAEEIFAKLPAPFRGAKFQTVTDSRSYPRHCSWCGAEIPPKTAGLMLYGVHNHRPRFCSEDCFESWECVYWQRLAISHKGLSKDERRLEERNLRRLARFLHCRR